MAAANDFNRLNGRQTADFRGAGAWCPRRVDTVDVEAQVHRTAADFLANFGHQWRQGFVPALFGLNHTEALVAAPVEVVSGVALGAQADLHDTVRVQQAFFNGATEGGAVGDFLAEHVIVHIGVGVDVHQADLAVLFMDGTQDRQGDGVVAAQGQGDHIVFEDVVVGLFDDPHGIQQVERVDCHVADVGNRQRVERCRTGGHVVRADHYRFGADVTRPEAGAGAQRSTDVQRHAYEGSVQTGSGRYMGESEHGGDAAEARHFVAAQWLVKNLVHG
ncbi:hypothetical protein D3C71_1459430 [compost metagenome]